MDPTILAWCAEHLQESERHNFSVCELGLTSYAICLTKTQILYTKAKRKVPHMKTTKENISLQFFQFGLWLQFFSNVLINKFSFSLLFVLYVTSLYSSKGEGIYYLENFKPQKTLKIKKNKDEVHRLEWEQRSSDWTICQKTLFHIKFLILNCTFDTAHNTLLTHFQP